MFCSSCGLQMAATARFCARCGTPVDVDTAATVLGNEAGPDANQETLAPELPPTPRTTPRPASTPRVPRSCGAPMMH